MEDKPVGIDILLDDDRIVLQFSKNIMWIALEKHAALALADTLTTLANAIKISVH